MCYCNCKNTVGYCWYLLLIQKLPFPPHLPIASPRPVSRAACSAAAGASDLYQRHMGTTWGEYDENVDLKNKNWDLSHKTWVQACLSTFNQENFGAASKTGI